MKTILILITILISIPAMAGEIIVQSTFPDLNPGDGICEEGSIANPYLLIDSDTGREIGIMEPTIPVLISEDNFLTPGSFVNPWRIELND